MDCAEEFLDNKWEIDKKNCMSYQAFPAKISTNNLYSVFQPLFEKEFWRITSYRGTDLKRRSKRDSIIEPQTADSKEDAKISRSSFPLHANVAAIQEDASGI